MSEKLQKDILGKERGRAHGPAWGEWGLGGLRIHWKARTGLCGEQGLEDLGDHRKGCSDHPGPYSQGLFSE